MNKSLFLIASVLICFFANSGNSAYAFTTNALPTLTSPTITSEHYNITKNSIFIRLEDTNASETSIELVYEGGGVITTVTLGPGTVFNLPINGLMPSTFYSFKARAIEGLIIGDYSTPVLFSTKVDNPPTPIVQLTYNCPTIVGISWTVATRPQDVTEYIIQRSFDNSSFVTIGNLLPSLRNFYDFDARDGRNIFYRVIAKNETALSFSPSLLVPVKPFTGPKDPINVTSSKTNKSRNHLTITWENPIEDTQCGSDIRATYYVFIKKYNETEYKIYTELYPGSTSVRIDGLSPKDVIDYRIQALSNKTLYGNRVGGRDTTSGPPYAPSNLIIVAFKDALGNSVLDASYKDNSNDEDYFIMEVSTDSVNFSQIAKTNFNITLIRHQPIQEGVKYFYRVKAGSNTEGESAYTPISFGVMYQYSEIPKAPYALSGKLVAGKAELKWFDDSNREATMELERSVDNQTGFTLLMSLPRNTVTFTDATVVSGKTYYYRVRAKNTKGESAFSNIAEVKVTGTSGAMLDSGISLYPNPSLDYAKITIPSSYIGKAGKITISDQSNLKLSDKTISAFTNELIIPVSELREGLYFITIETDNSKETKRFIKY